MEIGYLWVTLTAVLCLYGAGAAWGLTAAHAALAHADASAWPALLRAVRTRVLAAYALPALLAGGATIALLMHPPYNVDESALWRMLGVAVALLLALVATTWSYRRLGREGAAALPTLRRIHLAAAVLWTLAALAALHLVAQSFGLRL